MDTHNSEFLCKFPCYNNCWTFQVFQFLDHPLVQKLLDYPPIEKFPNYLLAPVEKIVGIYQFFRVSGLPTFSRFAKRHVFAKFGISEFPLLIGLCQFFKI